MPATEVSIECIRSQPISVKNTRNNLELSPETLFNVNNLKTRINEYTSIILTLDMDL